MNEEKENDISVNDFKHICRFCLQFKEDLVNIFSTDSVNQMMEFTNLKVNPDDNLPQALCQDCLLQMDHLVEFLHQANLSDSYLRSLLENEKMKLETDVVKINTTDITRYNSKHQKKKRKKLFGKSKSSKKLKGDSECDKMCVLFVEKVNDSESKAVREICIRPVDSDNLELFNFCQTLVKNVSDHLFPKEDFNDGDCLNLSESDIPKNIEFIDEVTDSRTLNNNTFSVNLAIYECTMCKDSFEDVTDLTNHFKSYHVGQLVILQGTYICPICFYEEGIRSNFLNHLQAHKDEGFILIKVNSSGGRLPLKESEENIFFESNLESNFGIKGDYRVFKLSLDSFKCVVCSKIIKSKGLISKHLSLCLSGAGDSFLTKYSCPVCQALFINEEKEFLQHLTSHQDVYYLKVDNSGQPCELKNDEEAFLPFDKAVIVTKLFDEIVSKKIVKVVDANSCDKCDYVGESFELICDHYSIDHGEKISGVPSFSCPVCSKKWDKGNVEENKVKFFDHLKIHRNRGVKFVLVKKNGSLSSSPDPYSGIFTYSSFLCSLVNNSSSENFNEIWCPEVVFLDIKKPEARYTCDLCQNQFHKKTELIKHMKSHQTKHRRSYVCEICGKTCLGKKTYQKHFLKHSRSRRICIICNKTFANRTALNLHIKQHVKEGVGEELAASLLGVACEKCGKMCSNAASLTVHKKYHLRDKENAALKCQICNRDFCRQSSYDRHKKAHLNPNYFECEVCKFPLSSSYKLQKHAKSHQIGSNTFDCKACKLSFLTEDALKTHQTHTGHYVNRTPLECNVCHEKFFLSKLFTEHIKTHSKYKMRECPLCGKRLSTAQALMLHLDRHFELNSILCPHCGKQFFEEKNYHRHLMTHKGIKPFRCDTEACEKSFYTFFELKRHKKYHNNTRDFVCPFCPKCFHEANHLTVHVRSHTGERPYICPHCKKGFITRTRCKNHIKLAHEGVGYDLIQSRISKKVTVFEAVEAVV